jgi:hypothetical protein
MPTSVSFELLQREVSILPSELRGEKLDKAARLVKSIRYDRRNGSGVNDELGRAIAHVRVV